MFVPPRPESAGQGALARLGDARVKAVLGPTNTGKTHLAMERLAAHSSGIIGFPLRLLARENYDRLAARLGAGRVALITGEEKIVPPGACWFSCTVEAMPLDRAVEFIAVDEIQLCADPDRGHVFTDRLLHARGLSETMFLGAETIRPLLRRLVPQAEIETRPRLSSLTHAGAVKLTHLPPRTAIVAFSADEVYALAETIRRRRGGCAVVMGRLSPRTRNAQVALYQEKEVDYLVATDAIGMGLNMDVDHVAFARLSKHDGMRPRRLRAPEIAQIAGRAGRGMRDGTFGTTAHALPLDEGLAMAVEGHHFDPLERLFWRNEALDFTSPRALLDSLNAAPPHPGLARGNEASDAATLAALIADPEIARLAQGRTGQGRAALRLLWDTCQIPDFRKLADETHQRLCARIFSDLARGAKLPTDWLAGQIAALDRIEGDIDTLMQRLAGVRVWSYIAARPDWLGDATHWQERTRAVEDRLSDALHASLTARFVDRRAAHLLRRMEKDAPSLISAVTRTGEVVVEGHPVGAMTGFRFTPDPGTDAESRKLVLRAARRALASEVPRRLAALEAAPDDAFSLNGTSIAWDGAPIARLAPGASLARPRIAVLDSEFLDGAARERVRQRLESVLAGWIAAGLAPLAGILARGRAQPALRGPLHRLEEGLGVLALTPAGLAGGAGEWSGPVRGALRALGVEAGRFTLFAPALLRPRAAAMRARLWAVQAGLPCPALPHPGRVAIPPPADWPAGFAAAMGWVAAGPLLLRADIAERLAARLDGLAAAGRPGSAPGHAPTRPADLAVLAASYAIPPAAWPAVLHALGFRILPAMALPAGLAGPPAPPRLVVRHPGPGGRKPARARAGSSGTGGGNESPARPVTASGPFAVLAALRRPAGGTKQRP